MVFFISDYPGLTNESLHSGSDERTPNFNRDRFNEIAGLVVKSGNIPLNPAILPDGLPERDYMAIGIAMLQCTDAICLIEGWENSAGARAEKALADKLNIPLLSFW